PQPDSPTRATVSAAPTFKSTCSTARKTPRFVLNSTPAAVTSSRLTRAPLATVRSAADDRRKSSSMTVHPDGIPPLPKSSGEQMCTRRMAPGRAAAVNLRCCANLRSSPRRGEHSRATREYKDARDARTEPELMLVRRYAPRTSPPRYRRYWRPPPNRG